MTVIAYRDGVLASDSRETWSKDFIGTDSSKKLFRLGKNMFLALAGHSMNGYQMLDHFRRWIKSKGQKNFPLGPYKGVEAIYVDKTDVFLYASGGWISLKDSGSEYTALGAGYVSALAAMDAGASAEEAVKITLKRNVYCGGRIQKMEVK